jgi:hypothetical protein
VDPKPSKQILPEIPFDEIKELAARQPYVYLNLRRRNGRGAMGFIAGLSIATNDLSDGSLEKVLAENYGGGEFHVDARNPENRMEVLLPTYSTSIDGMPKPANVPQGAPGEMSSREQRQARANMPMASQPVPAAVYPGNPWFPQQPAAGARPQDFMERTPDGYLSEQTQQLREDIAKLQEMHADAQRRAENRIEQLRADNERLRLEQRERDQQHARDLQEARFRDLEAKLQNPAKPAIDLNAISALIAALVPVLTAMVNASKERAALMVTQQQNAANLQMEGLKTMVTAQSSKKPDFDLKTLVELGTPLVTAFLSNRDPAKMADLMTAAGENQLGLLSLVANMVGQMGGEAESPMMRIIQEAIAGAVNVAEKMAASREPQPPAPRQPPQAAPQPQPTQQPAPRRRVAGAPPAQPRVVEAPQTPDQLARMMLADKDWPAAMRTPQWQVIMRDIHDPEAPVEETALAFARALDALYDAGRLPPSLLPLFDAADDELPAIALSLFENLPVWENQGRARALAKELVESLHPPADDDAAADASVEGNGVGHTSDDDELGPAVDEDDDGVLDPARTS